MIYADYAIALMYVCGFLFTRMLAFAYCAPAMAMSMVLGWACVDLFSVPKGGSEYLYFLLQAAIWIYPVLTFRAAPLLALFALSMPVYEWLVSVESFVWQYVTPVETALHSEYAWIVIGMHLLILSSITKWGGEIGYFTWANKHRRHGVGSL
ncbi:hypothetical protein [Leclercia sp.]|uniref:hypothetical protein n=1 Tax=Leclercia sp. TaxID=1898428 RepID=UPI0028AE2B92|nr:hypothetical protein [Leclercia sp.]